MAKDYYEILGVQKNSPKSDIKKAFHKLAHTHHPDKNGGDDKKFKEVNEAYQTLSDDKKRAQYDQFGSEGPSFAGQGQQGSGFGGFDPSGFDFSGGGFDMGDIFGDIFGGGRQQRRRRGADLQTTMTIDFKESIFGVTKELRVTKPSTCITCKGGGAQPGTKLETCTKCEGKGSLRVVQRTILGSIATNQTCDKCHGTGKIPQQPCKTCRGSGVVNEARTLKVNIPSGISNGETLRLSGMGETISGQGESGDLYVHITVSTHKTISRQGNDLVTNHNIKLTDALLGIEHSIETLDGIKTVTIPSGTKIDDTVVLKNFGVPHGSKRGNFIIKLTITLPEKLSKKSKELIEELKKEGI